MIPRPLAMPLALGIALLAAGCAAPTGPRATPEQAAACRQRADEVYDRQNRADLYRSDVLAGGARDAMFSGTGAPGGQAQALSARFARDRMVDDCLRGVAGHVASTPDAPGPVPAPPRARP